MYRADTIGTGTGIRFFMYLVSIPVSFCVGMFNGIGSSEQKNSVQYSGTGTGICFLLLECFLSFVLYRPITIGACTCIFFMYLVVVPNRRIQYNIRYMVLLLSGCVLNGILWVVRCLVNFFMYLVLVPFCFSVFNDTDTEQKNLERVYVFTCFRYR